MSPPLPKLVPQPPPFPVSLVALSFEFENRWGLHKAALYYDAVNHMEQAPLILLAHGLGSDMDYHRWQIQLLTNEGYAIVAYTLPGNIASQLMKLALTSRLRERRSVMTLFSDGVRSCLNHVLMQRYVPKIINYTRIGALGHSGGAAGIVIEASKPDTHLACIVPMATPVRDHILLPKQVLLPIQMQHGTLDKLCPYKDVLAYYDELVAPDKQLITIDGANHSQYMDTRMVDLNLMRFIDNMPEITTKTVHTISGNACLEWFNAFL